MRALLVMILVLGGVARAPACDVFVVDPDGGGDFTDLQTAIDTVPEGSTLLVALNALRLLKYT